jgi:protein Tex
MDNAAKPATGNDLDRVAKSLSISPQQVATVAELLEQGNTVAFIARYRSDATGGLQERHLVDIRNELARFAALAERKAIILKSIEGQEALTADLRNQIESANSSKQLEDLYLPFKPRKQSLATVARQQGLEPLARDILEARTSEVDLPTRAAEFVRVDRGLNSIDEVFRGVRHLLAERFSEHQGLRRALRKLFWDQGSVEAKLVESPASAARNQKGSEAPAAVSPAKEETADSPPVTEVAEINEIAAELVPDAGAEVHAASPAAAEIAATDSSEESVTPPVDSVAVAAEAAEAAPAAVTAEEPAPAESVTVVSMPAAAPSVQVPPASGKKEGRGKKKKKKKKDQPEPFAEFANFSQAVQKVPPHRVLGINRGERAGRLKVQISVPQVALNNAAFEALLPVGHPFIEFLREAANDALSRMIVPSIERELRRELTERAEDHAVKVFARNLRSLVLQHPVRGHRIMGIDPGYRSGCKVAVIDEQGQPLGHGVFSIIGNEERLTGNRQRLKDLLDQHKPSFIAIGNGSGCHAVEQFVSEVLAAAGPECRVEYAIVNQAGTSTYSTSEIAREELPDFDPLVRSALSIARRLQDPLSELAKVHPAHIGIGMYQHDVRAKHLADILNEELESCVNLVGVNVNTASVPLLRHISGLGPVTARRIVEHRTANGPFPNREALRAVSGMGDVTWKQSIGFMRVPSSENLLDRTSIHPESYEAAQAILKQLDGRLEDLFFDDNQPLQNGQETPDAATDGRKQLSPSELVALRQRKFELMRRLRSADPVDLSQKTGAGEMTVRDILRSFRNPDFDPRETRSGPLFRKGVLRFEDLKPDMKLRAQVVNVVDFGVFVNIGLGDSCLIHISRLSNRFIRDPHWHFAVADILDVWVKDIDATKKRVTLTAIPPESEVAAQEAKHSARREPARRSGQPAAAGAGQSRTDSRPSSRPQGRPSYAKGPRGGQPAERGAGKAAASRSFERKPSKPKPVTPITDEMVKGKKPMRSFSDLMQFHQRKTTGDEPESKG